MAFTGTSGAEWNPSPDRNDGVKLVAAVCADIGRVRSHNEDAWALEPPVFAVADGMGGHDGGDVASRIVVDSLAVLRGRSDVTASDIEGCVVLARAEVDALASDGRGAPGSTLVAAAYVAQEGSGYWLVGNIGDSRAYLWAGGSLEQISTDHSIVQEMIDAGEIDALEARSHPDRHVITRAIGALEESVAEFSLVPATPGSRLLLCSDGLSGELDDSAISDVLAAGLDAQVTVRELVDAAVSAGGHDNVTALIADVLGAAVEAVEEVTLTPSGAGVGEDTIRTVRR